MNEHKNYNEKLKEAAMGIRSFISHRSRVTVTPVRAWVEDRWNKFSWRSFYQPLPISEDGETPNLISRRTEFTKLFLGLLLLLSSIILYGISLVGGPDAKWIQDHLPTLASLLLSSVFASLVGVILSVTCYLLTRNSKLGILFLWMIPFIIMFLANSGTSTKNHGGMNSVAYLILFVPMIGTCFLFVYLYRKLSTKKFLIVFFLFTSFIPIVATIRFIAVHGSWQKGYGGEELRNDGIHCTVDFPILEWNSLLPYRWMNFYTGSTSCPASYELATIKDGMIIVDCDEDEGAVLYELPSTEDWDFEWKTPVDFEVNQFQESILSNLTEVKYTSPYTTTSPAILVTCGTKSQLLIQNSVKVESIKRVEEIRDNKEQSEFSNLNVLFLNVDAFSRTHSFRRWPKTMQFLDSISSEDSKDARSFQFFRYHTLEYFTVPNDQSMYLGFHEMNSSTGSELNDASTIWEDYSDNGYITAYADNSCLDWSVKYQYNRTSVVDYQFVAPFCLPESHPLGNPFGALVGPFSIRRRCLVGDYNHRWLLNWMKEFQHNHRGIPTFAAAAFNEAHEGTGEVIGLMDEDMEAFLKQVILNDTVVFLISDHGLHMSPYFALKAYSARAEAALPMGNLIVPQRLLKSRPDIAQALEANQQALVTPYDLWMTMQHLMDLNNEPVGRRPWAKSLFTPISPKRSCEEVGIPESVCKCH